MLGVTVNIRTGTECCRNTAEEARTLGPEGGGRQEAGKAAEKGEPQSMVLHVPQDKASTFTPHPPHL